MQSGDVILAYDGKTLTRSAELPPLVATTAIGETVALKVLRDGKERQIDITVGNLGARGNPLAAAAPGPLGMTVANLEAEEKQRFKDLLDGNLIAIGEGNRGYRKLHGYEGL